VEEQIDTQLASWAKDVHGHGRGPARRPKWHPTVELDARALKKLVLETQALVSTARVDGRGVLLDSRRQLYADSHMARQLKQVVRPKRDLLRGLPAGETPFVVRMTGERAGGRDLHEAMPGLLSMDSLRRR